MLVEDYKQQRLEKNLARDREDSMEGVLAMRLNISEKYQYFDKNEVKWVFSYQKLGDDEGWFVWMTRPGQPEFCVGRLDEREVVEKLAENPALTSDDFIDLELWLKHGGLDVYQPRKKEKK